MLVPYCHRISRTYTAWNQLGPKAVLGKLRIQAFASGQSGGLGILEGRDDRYHGFIVDPDKLPEEPTAFSRQLSYSLEVIADKYECIMIISGLFSSTSKKEF